MSSFSSAHPSSPSILKSYASESSLDFSDYDYYYRLLRDSDAFIDHHPHNLNQLPPYHHHHNAPYDAASSIISSPAFYSSIYIPNHQSSIPSSSHPTASILDFNSNSNSNSNSSSSSNLPSLTSSNKNVQSSLFLKAQSSAPSPVSYNIYELQKSQTSQQPSRSFRLNPSQQNRIPRQQQIPIIKNERSKQEEKIEENYWTKRKDDQLGNYNHTQSSTSETSFSAHSSPTSSTTYSLSSSTLNTNPLTPLIPTNRRTLREASSSVAHSENVNKNQSDENFKFSRNNLLESTISQSTSTKSILTHKDDNKLKKKKTVRWKGDSSSSFFYGMSDVHDLLKSTSSSSMRINGAGSFSEHVNKRENLHNQIYYYDPEMPILSSSEPLFRSNKSLSRPFNRSSATFSYSFISPSSSPPSYEYPSREVHRMPLSYNTSKDLEKKYTMSSLEPINFFLPLTDPTSLKDHSTISSCIRMVQLIDISCNTFPYVEGLIRVRNLDYEKELTVRFTMNQWRSFTDYIGPSASDSIKYSHSVGLSWDYFTFKIPLPIFKNSSNITLNDFSRIDCQFAIRYRVKGMDYWDNHFGTNYQFSLTPTSMEDQKNERNNEQSLIKERFEILERNLEDHDNLKQEFVSLYHPLSKYASTKA